MTRYFCDIETTGLSAKEGHIVLMCSFANDFDNNIVTLSNGDVPYDDGYVQEICDFIDKGSREDYFYWFNGFGFDLRFINHRRQAAGLWPKAWNNQIDLLFDAKELYPYLPDHKLDTVAHALGVETEKTPLDVDINIKCARDVHDDESWSQLKEHNQKDVLVLREVYEKIYGL